MVLLLVAGAALPFVFDSIKVQYQLILDFFNKINGNSPSLYRWEMNRKNKLSVSGGQISPTDMRSNYTSLKGVAALCEITERGLKQTLFLSLLLFPDLLDMIQHTGRSLISLNHLLDALDHIIQYLGGHHVQKVEGICGSRAL